MNKTELIDHVAKSTDLDRTEARTAVEAVIKGITAALENSEHVTLIDFGSFGLVDRAARNGYNPRLKTKMRVQSTKVVKFTASAKLKSLIKESKSSKI